MYIIESSFWLKFILFLIIIGVLLHSFSTVMSKLLKVEKRKMFGYNHISERHKKIDRVIRITFIFILIASFIYNVTGDPTEKVWFFEIWFVIILHIIVAEVARAIMEWKYEVNRNAYILTISKLIFSIILIYFIIATNFFSFF